MPSEPIDTRTPAHATLNGRRLTVFGGCDYLGLSRAPAVIDAVRAGLDRYGLSVTASRETSGNTAAHTELEALAAGFFEPVLAGASALLCPDGYTANLIALQTLAAMGVREAVIADRAHQSLHDATRFVGLEIKTYARDRAGEAAAAARGCARPVVLTDGVFASDGAVAPVTALLDALPSQALLLIDDCHGVACLGDRGRGTLEALGVRERAGERVVLTTTLAKGVGAMGGLMVGSVAMIERARTSASVYIGTTPTPPAVAMAASAALREIDRDPSRLRRLRDNTERLHKTLATVFGSHAATTAAADGVSNRTPIATWSHEDPAVMDRVDGVLRDRGLLVPLIEYPGGPAPRYFRCSVNADHTADDLSRLGEALAAADAPHADATLSTEGAAGETAR
ncbi:MAG: pyridoxal phosphate-dependent aminotransferase family protein [Planctomycetota bacterium]